MPQTNAIIDETLAELKQTDAPTKAAPDVGKFALKQEAQEADVEFSELVTDTKKKRSPADQIRTHSAQGKFQIAEKKTNILRQIEKAVNMDKGEAPPLKI